VQFSFFFVFKSYIGKSMLQTLGHYFWWLLVLNILERWKYKKI